MINNIFHRSHNLIISYQIRSWKIKYILLLLHANFHFAVSLVFGIPTIKREKTSYLLNTLASLLDGMTQEDKDDSVIVVFVGEVNTFILLLSQPLSDKNMMCSQLYQISPWIPKGDYRGYNVPLLYCNNSRNW